MKTLFLSKLALLLLFISVALNVKAFEIVGKVLNAIDESPVINHSVYFTFHQNSDSLIVLTNSEGAFTANIELNDAEEVYIEIFTEDPCNGSIHRSAIYPFTSSNYILFRVCSEDSTGSECVARFEYYNGIFSQDSTVNSDSTINSLYTVYFYNLSIGNIINWQWNFGDGTTSNEQNPIHNYTNPGEYWVTLIINGSNCIDTTVSQVWIGNNDPNCYAYFYYDFGITSTTDSTNSDSTFNDFLTVNFYDYSWGSPTHWEWNFGDGNSSMDQNPTHTYNEPGEYFVSLYISGENCENWIEMPVWVGNYLPPCQAMFGYDYMNWYDSTTTTTDISISNSENTIYFYDYSYGQISSWNWDFGDGFFSTEKNPVHTFIQMGEYQVTLKINGDDCESSYTSPVFVGNNDTVWLPEKCQAIFYPLVESNNNVSFINQSYGEIINYLWNFGDGTTSNEISPHYQYALEGEYLVSLSISTIDSCQSIFEMWVWVGNYNNDSVINPLFIPEILGNTVIFHDQSTGVIWNWFWDFGDGMSSTSQNPIHIYDSLSTYYVTLGISNGNAVRTFSMEINLVDGTFKGFFGEDEATHILKINTLDDIHCIPNPFNNSLNVTLTSSVSTLGTIHIYSVTGKLECSQNISIESGINHFPLNLPHLSKGLYFIELRNNNTSNAVLKIIKQ